MDRKEPLSFPQASGSISLVRAFLLSRFPVQPRPFSEACHLLHLRAYTAVASKKPKAIGCLYRFLCSQISISPEGK